MSTLVFEPTDIPGIARCSRGLSFTGTRLTLYSFLDCVHAGWPRDEIRDWLRLTEDQVSAAYAYMDAHGEELDKEYREVLRQAEETRRYWEERNAELLRKVRSAPPRNELHARVRKKLEEWESEPQPI